MTKGKEVTTTEGTGLIDPAMADMFDTKENMEGVVPEFPGIKIIHQGQMFELPDGKKSETLSGIIIDISRANAWWAESFDDTGGGTPPDCFSMDGVFPSHDGEDIQHEDCASCPKNQYGSVDGGGRGKACKNMKRIFILVPGEMFPFRLTVPPTNIKPVDRYITQLTSKGLPYQLVITELGLVKAQNKDGIEYSELTFANTDTIQDMGQAQSIKQMVNDLRESMRGVAINSADVDG